MKNIISNLRKQVPLVHHITNYVTVNDCANATIAIGGSAVMADYIEEMDDFSKFSSSLVLNTGTINREKANSMLKASKAYNLEKKPMVLDPVGLGASKARDKINFEIINSANLSIIKGNASEIGTLIGYDGKTRGVDSSISVNEDFIKQAQFYLNNKSFILAVTGKIDYIIDSNKIAKIYNGSIMASKITGAGCMCGSLCGVFSGVYEPFNAALYALVSFGIASERAENKSIGTGSFRANLLDFLSTLDDESFDSEARYEII